MHAWVEIDLEAIRQNVTAIRRALRFSVDFIAMVKGNGYGHGALEVSRAALEAGATHLGVAFVSEGRELRAAGISAPILVLGSFSESEIEDLLTYRLTPSVAERDLAASLSEAALGRGVRTPIHIEIDTGMGRLGVDWREGEALVEAMTALPGLAVEGIYTHFSTADESDPTFTRLQMKRFHQVSEGLKQRGIFIPFRHNSNSAGLLGHPELAQDAIRPGLAIYGLYPNRQENPAVLLQPALTFCSRVVLVKRMGAGTFVSYNRTFRLPDPRFIATISVGYADGYPRNLSNRGSVLIRGERYPVVGNVTMDHIMVDLGRDATAVSRGDRVTLLGRDGSECITAEEVAEAAGTINYEVTTRITSRARRVFLDQGTS